MSGRVNVEIRLKGAKSISYTTYTDVEDVNPPVSVVFTAFDPEAEGMTITEDGDVQIAFGNQWQGVGEDPPEGWVEGDYWHTYTGRLVPAEPLTDYWTITGDLNINTSIWGYQTNYGSEQKAYLGIGDPTTDFIGLKLKWTHARGLGNLSIYMVSIFSGSENATLLKSIDTGEEAVTATGTFTLRRINETTYKAELEIWGGGTDSRNGTFTNPDITVYSEDSKVNYLYGILEWKNLNRS